MPPRVYVYLYMYTGCLVTESKFPWISVDVLRNVSQDKLLRINFQRQIPFVSMLRLCRFFWQFTLRFIHVNVLILIFWNCNIRHETSHFYRSSISLESSGLKLFLKNHTIGWKILPHSSYFSSDYHLFRSLENFLDGWKIRQFRENTVDEFFVSKNETFFAGIINKLPKTLAEGYNEGNYTTD